MKPVSNPDEPTVPAPCDACTGDGGTGHTLRGACRGAPCTVCGDALYRHLPDECAPKLHHIPSNERYFLDAEGFCWREVTLNGEVWHSMARTNPDNSPTAKPYLYLAPVAESAQAANPGDDEQCPRCRALGRVGDKRVPV